MAGGKRRIKRLTTWQTEALMWYLRAEDIATEDSMNDGTWAVNLQQAAVDWLASIGRVDPYHDEGYTIVYDFYLDWRLAKSEKHVFFKIGE